jgi:hypothetical protein
MEQIGVIKLCLTEAYTRVRVGNSLSDMCAIMNGLNVGGALSPFLYTFDLEYAIRFDCSCMVNIFTCVILMVFNIL